MSAVISISTRRRYGVARVCRVWHVARSSLYRSRRAAVAPPAPRRRPGPQGPTDDAGLVTAIRRGECQDLCGSGTGPFPRDRPQPPSGLKRSSNMMAN